MLPVLLLSLIAAEPASAVTAQDAPVRITLNNDRRFVRGDRAKVKVEVENDGYLLVLHADPDGQLRVLFPLDPADDNFVRGDRTYEIRGRGDREAFTVDVSSGEGAIYAAISASPFRFAEFVVNDHWDYRALSDRDLPENPEPELSDLARRMIGGGRFEYDYLTYNVYRRDDVAYGGTTVVYRNTYIDPFCGNDYYFRYDCDPYYYRPRSSVLISFGYPYRYAFRDPYYYGGYDPFYDPYYYGRRYYDPYPGRYYGRPVGVFPVYPYRPYSPYRPRFLSPGDFKQASRTWGGQSYRDRTGSSTTQATHTVYGEPPARRNVTTNDPGRSPVAPSVSRDLGDRPSRREAEKEKDSRNGVVGARPEPSKGTRSEDSPTIERRSTDRTAERVTPQRGIREDRGEPELRRRERSSERTEPSVDRGSRATDDRPAVDRSPPSRATYAAPERRERSEPRAEPRSEPRNDPSPARAAPRYDPPPRSAPAPQPRSAPSGDGGGRRRT